MKLFFIVLAVVVLPLTVDAQCKTWAKQECVSALSPYMSSGKPNTTVLSPGDNTEIMMTFFSGQEYRILFCAQPVLEHATFEVRDKQGSMIFDSKEAGADYFDFRMSATQQLVVSVDVPEAENMVDNYEMGCISLVTGMKY